MSRRRNHLLFRGSYRLALELILWDYKIMSTIVITQPRVTNNKYLIHYKNVRGSMGIYRNLITPCKVCIKTIGGSTRAIGK